MSSATPTLGESLFVPTEFLSSLIFGGMLSFVVMMLVGIPTGLFWAPLSLAGVFVGAACFIQGLFVLDIGIHGRPFLLGKLVGGKPFGADMKGGLYWRIPAIVQVRTIDMKPFSLEIRERTSGNELVPNLPTRDGNVRVFMTVQAVYTDSVRIFFLDSSISDSGLNDTLLGTLREKLRVMTTDEVRELTNTEAVRDILETAQRRLNSPERLWPFKILSIDLDDINLPQRILDAMEKAKIEERHLHAEKIELDGVNARVREMVNASREGGFEIDGADAYDNVADERGKMQGRKRLRIDGLNKAARILGEGIGHAIKSTVSSKELPDESTPETEEGGS